MAGKKNAFDEGYRPFLSENLEVRMNYLRLIDLNKTTFKPPKTVARFVALAVETTGFIPFKDRIVDIGLAEVLVKLHGYREQEEVLTTELTGTRYRRLFDPGFEYFYPEGFNPTIAQRNLSYEDSFGDSIDEIVNFINGDVIIAHNLYFHLDFLAAEFGRCGYGLDYQSTDCIQQISRDYWGYESDGLRDICERFEIEFDDIRFPNAYYYAELVARSWLKLKEKNAYSKYYYHNSKEPSLTSEQLEFLRSLP
ncbi:MAG: hypothetical protein QM523_05730 [Candidatus Pacebacteria bacterium]|nr:hypothetical protein [Candidatus Paceibacterota bacterium]